MMTPNTLVCRIGRRTTLLLGAAILAAGANAQVIGAEAGAAEVFDGISVYTKHELAKMKGGFVSAGGLAIEIGATVRTFIDGALVMETMVTLTDPESLVNHVFPAQGGEPLASGLRLILRDGNGDTSLPPLPGFDISGLAGAEGLLVDRGGDGIGIALHRINSGTILNLVMESGVGSALEQRLDINITVRNFAKFQQQARAAVSLSRMLSARP